MNKLEYYFYIKKIKKLDYENIHGVSKLTQISVSRLRKVLYNNKGMFKMVKYIYFDGEKIKGNKLVDYIESTGESRLYFKSYKEVGEKIGVTKQAVHQMIAWAGLRVHHEIIYEPNKNE